MDQKDMKKENISPMSLRVFNPLNQEQAKWLEEVLDHFRAVFPSIDFYADNMANVPGMRAGVRDVYTGRGSPLFTPAIWVVEKNPVIWIYKAKAKQPVGVELARRVGDEWHLLNLFWVAILTNFLLCDASGLGEKGVWFWTFFHRSGFYPAGAFADLTLPDQEP